MASAAQKFFAIPELLEQVLLELGGNEVLPKKGCSKEIFALQRVNWMFASTIRGSQKLSLQMKLRDQLPTARSTGPIRHLDLASRMFGDLGISPFKYCKRTAVPHHGASSRPKRIWLNFSAVADYFAEEYQGSEGYRAGVEGKSGRIYSQQYHSWREIRLTTAPVPIVVSIKIFKPRKELIVNEFFGESYTEWVRLRPGTWTLGDLADLFEEIGRKSRVDHEEGTVRYAGAQWTHVDRKLNASLSKSRLLELFAGCCGVWLVYVFIYSLWASMFEHPLLWVSLVVALCGGYVLIVLVDAWLEKMDDGQDGGDIKECRIYN